MLSSLMAKKTWYSFPDYYLLNYFWPYVSAKENDKVKNLALN